MSKIDPPFQSRPRRQSIAHTGDLRRPADYRRRQARRRPAPRGRGPRDRGDDPQLAATGIERSPTASSGGVVPPRLPPAARRDHGRRSDRLDLGRRGDRALRPAAHHGHRQAHPRAPDPGRRLPLRGRQHARGCQPEVAIPSPTMAHFRGGRAASTSSRIPTSTASSTISPRCTATRSRCCTRPAAVTSSSTTPASPTSAIPACARVRSTAATTPTTCRAPAALINEALEGRPRRPHGRYPPLPGQLPQRTSPPAATTRSPRCCSTSSEVDAYFLEYDDAVGRSSPRCASCHPTRRSCSG